MRPAIHKKLSRLFMPLLFLLAGTLPAQIVIWPPRPIPPEPMPPRPPLEIRQDPVELRKLGVDAQVRDQNAEVRLTQTFYNPNSNQLEAEYLFPVPEGSSIQDFVLMVDGKELTGKLMDANEARATYQEIVRRMKDPGLLQFVGRGLLKTSVFPIPGRAERTVTLKYTQLLKKEEGRIDLRIPLGAPGADARRAAALAVEIRIESREALKSLYSPNSSLTIARDGDHRATARLDQRDATPDRDLRLVIGLDDRQVGATLLSTRPTESEDGYFLMLASPDVKTSETKPLPKSVIFVLDRSGSMTGKKIEQAQGAMRFVLKNLHDGDTFNVIAYDDRVESFRPELQRYDNAGRDEALKFVDNIRAGGSTNIDEALRTALAMLPDDKTRPSYVIFMTDGLPTAGEKNETSIADRARAANKSGARVFSFGVGDDVNARLLDRISGGNGGTTEFVRPDEDIEASVSHFYSRMSSPVMTRLQFSLDKIDTNRVTPRDLPDLFQGSQLVVVGRYRQSGKTSIHLMGQVGGKEQSMDFPAELAAAGAGVENSFVERLWATRRLGELIDAMDQQGQSKELLDELVALSKKYGILTPYTAFLAEEKTDLAMQADMRQRVAMEARSLDAVSGSAAVDQRAMKSSMSGAVSAPASTYYASPAGMGGAGARGGELADVDSPPQRETLRQAGSKTFYLRDGRWVDSESIDSKAPVETVEAYSEAWFALAQRLGPGRAAWLDFKEPVTLAAEGKIYRIELPR